MNLPNNSAELDADRRRWRGVYFTLLTIAVLGLIVSVPSAIEYAVAHLWVDFAVSSVLFVTSITLVVLLVTLRRKKRALGDYEAL